MVVLSPGFAINYLIAKPGNKMAAPHYNDITMDATASQITSLTIFYSTIYSDGDQRKPKCSASLAFVRGIHRWPVNSPHKWPVTWKMFPFNDVIVFMTHFHIEGFRPKWAWKIRVRILHWSFWCWNQNIQQDLGQFHGCWCPGSFCRQAISNHVIDYGG